MKKKVAATPSLMHLTLESMINIGHLFVQVQSHWMMVMGGVKYELLVVEQFPNISNDIVLSVSVHMILLPSTLKENVISKNKNKIKIKNKK